jgi:hypothetical protein
MGQGATIECSMACAGRLPYTPRMRPLLASLFPTALLGLVLTGCPSDPAPLDAPFFEDALWVTDDAFAPGEDASFDSCPVPQTGRWVIGALTYSGPDCVPDWTIDTEYHPVAFRVDDTGQVTDCECDTAGDTCTVEIVGSRRPPCAARISCRGNSLEVTFQSTASSVVTEHRLASRSGYCYASGPFTPE